MSEEVSFWLHCKKCLDERPGGISPKDYARQQIGVTPFGETIVWCNRHNMEVARLEMSNDQAAKFETCTCGECNLMAPKSN